MQIDAVRVENKMAVCNLYTGDRCVRILISEADYWYLIRDGFFIRDGRTLDSAGVMNTTAEYRQIEYEHGRPQLK